MATKTASMPDTSHYSLESFINVVNNNFVVILLVGIAFVIGFFVGSLWTENQILKGNNARAGSQPTVAAEQQEAPEGPTQEQLAQVPQVTGSDHILGDQNAKIVLIEYSDYQCPYCGRFHPTIAKIAEEYGSDVAWVYRHYPLPFHPNAAPAAETAECMAKLGGNDAFWAYSDALFESNVLTGTITAADIETAISEAGLDVATVQACVDSGEFKQFVSDQMAAASTAGVSGTPGTILVTSDGEYELISGALPYEQIKQIVENYL